MFTGNGDIILESHPESEMSTEKVESTHTDETLTNINDSWMQILGKVTEFMIYYESIEAIIKTLRLMRFLIQKYYLFKQRK